MPSNDDEGKITRIRGLTDKEKELLEALIEYKTVTKASQSLGISVSLASGRKNRLIIKYMQAKKFIKDFDYYKMRLPSVLGV